MNPIIIILIIITIVGVSYYMYSNSSKDTTGLSTSKNDQKEEIQREEDWIKIDDSNYNYKYKSNPEYTLEFMDLKSIDADKAKENVANKILESMYLHLIFKYVIYAYHYFENNKKEELKYKKFKFNIDDYSNSIIVNYINKKYKHLNISKKIIEFAKLFEYEEDEEDEKDEEDEEDEEGIFKDGIISFNNLNEADYNKYKNELNDKLKYINIDNLLKNYIKIITLKSSRRNYMYLRHLSDSKIIDIYKEHIRLRHRNIGNKWSNHILLKYKNVIICQVSFSSNIEYIEMQGITQNFHYFTYLKSLPKEEFKNLNLKGTGSLIISFVHQKLLELRKINKNFDLRIHVHPTLNALVWKEKLKDYNDKHEIFDITG